MAFEYLTNVPLEQAKRDYLALLVEQGYAPRTQVIPVQQACGRVTAQPVYAHICAPHYAASAMDGVAVIATLVSLPLMPARIFIGRRNCFLFSSSILLILPLRSCARCRLGP